MKRKLLFIPIIAMSLPLAACKESANAINYSTPELFFSQVNVDAKNALKVTSSTYPNTSDYYYYDSDLSLKQAILDIKEFTPIEKFKNKETSNFTYELYRKPAMTGPNYVDMIVYEDGYLMIDYRESLSAHSYFCFSFDAAKASYLVDLANQKIETAARERQEAKEEAIEALKPENFFPLVNNQEKLVQVWESEEKQSKSFMDDNDTILNLMKNATYTSIEEIDTELSLRYVISTNDIDSRIVEADYLLSKDFKVVNLILDYRATNKRRVNVHGCYSIDVSQGQAIYNKAIELATN